MRGRVDDGMGTPKHAVTFYPKWKGAPRHAESVVSTESERGAERALVRAGFNDPK
jgi:hypothetical protein